MKKYAILILGIFCISFTNAQYRQDYSDAYEWAQKNGITEDQTLEDAHLDSTISRIEFASILMKYAKNILKMNSVGIYSCHLIDINGLSDGYREAAEWLCSKGIMGIGKTTFNPYDSISLASFGTTLSRLFWGDKYSGGSPYYENHIGALKGIGIIDDVSNPFKILVKGEVLTMLMKSVRSIDYSNPIVTKKSDTNTHNAAGISNIEKVAKCYSLVDACRNSATNGDIACEYICCDENGYGVTAGNTNKCAPKPDITYNYNDNYNTTGYYHNAADYTDYSTNEYDSGQIEKIEKCYQIIDKCNNSGIGDNKSCQFVCCDRNGFGVPVESSKSCVERPKKKAVTCGENWDCKRYYKMQGGIGVLIQEAKWLGEGVITDEEINKVKEYIRSSIKEWFSATIDVIYKENITEDQTNTLKEDNEKIKIKYSGE